MEKFLETYNLARENQKERKNLDRSITSKETESIKKKLSMEKSPGIDGPQVNFTKHLKNN